MTTLYDFKLTDYGDIYIDPVAMDFVIAPSGLQHVKDIMISAPGDFKEFALVGFNPYNRINARGNKLELNQAAKIQLQNDGWTVRPGGLDIEVDPSGKVTINVLDITR